MQRFDSLMDESRQRLSEKSADKAVADAQTAVVEATKIAEVNMPSAAPTMMVGLAHGSLPGAYDDIMAVRVAKQKGFVDAMYQTEKSHIPTPDDPPIVYPDAEVWKELTARRKEKYSSTEPLAKQPGREEDRRGPQAAYADRIRGDAVEGRRRLSQGPAQHRDPA